MKFLAALRVMAAGLALGAMTPAAVLADEPARPAPPAAPPAASEATAAEVVILHATNDGTGIDPKLGKMPELGKPPFSSYNSYKLLERVKMPLKKGASATTKLPNDRVLAVTLKEVLAPKKKGEPIRYLVNASIQKPGGTTFLPLLEVSARADETFFVAGQTHKGGILVIGIKVAE